jgi:hypothetical protein
MTQKLLTLPFRVGFSAARTALDLSARTLDLSAKLAGTAIEILRPGGGHSDAQTPPSPPAQRPSPPAQRPSPPAQRPSPPAQPARANELRQAEPGDRAGSRAPQPARSDRVNGHPAAAPAAPPAPTPPPAPASVTPPDEQPDTPLSHQQEVVKTLEDEDEVVAEFAEPGAEDGAGAQLDVQEPWAGYARMNASTIIARIDQAGPAELALLELYEQTHKKRQTVLGAAAKRLRALSPPESE